MTAGMSPDQAVFNHVGICVTDLDRSRRFYQDVLQFRFWWELDAPDEGTSQLLEVPQPVGLHAVYMVRDGLVLELLHFAEAGTRAFRQRVMNEPGLTHLSFSVGDIPAVIEKVVPSGGEVLDRTDMQAAIMIRDPDGQLIELTSAAWREVLPPLPD